MRPVRGSKGETKCGQSAVSGVRPNAISPRFQGWDHMRPVRGSGGRNNVVRASFREWHQMRPVRCSRVETKSSQSAVPGLRPNAVPLRSQCWKWGSLWLFHFGSIRMLKAGLVPISVAMWKPHLNSVANRQSVRKASNSASLCPDFLLLWMSSQIYTCSPVGVASRPAGFVLVPVADNMSSAGHKWSSIFVLAALARFVLVSIPSLQLDLNGYY